MPSRADHINIWVAALLSSTPIFVFFTHSVLTMSYFRQLSVPAHLLGWMWLPGPVVGLLVLPLSAKLSDKAYWDGQGRKQYIISGGVMSAVALLMMPLAQLVESDQNSVWVAVFLFALSMCCANFMEPPGRAIVMDLAREKEVVRANVLCGMFAAVAHVLVGILLSMRISDHTHIVPVLYVSAGVVVLSMTLTTMFVAERPPAMRAIREGIDTSTAQSRCKIVEACFGPLPRVLQSDPTVRHYILQVWFSQYLTSASNVVFVTFMGTWLGEVVLHGDANAPDGSEAARLFKEGSITLVARSAMHGALGSVLMAPLLVLAIREWVSRNSILYAGMAAVQAGLMMILQMFNDNASMACFIYGSMTSIRIILQFVARYDLLSVDPRLTVYFGSTMSFVNMASCMGQITGNFSTYALRHEQIGFETLYSICGSVMLGNALVLLCLPILTHPVGEEEELELPPYRNRSDEATVDRLSIAY